jgi:diguanylate cyclase (GGDEF)-like protein
VPLEQILLTVLGAVILVNAFLIATIPFRLRARPRAVQHDQTPVTRPPANDPGAEGDTLAAEAIEAFVADVSPDAAGGARPPAPSEVIALRDALTGTAPAGSVRTAGGQARRDRPERQGRSRPSGAVPGRSVGAPEIAIAGLADPAAWDRTVRAESARVARFSRPVTVVMAELPNLDDIAGRLGRAAADRVVTETARLLVSQGRAVDRIAWLGDARFGVLLVETEAAGAGGYVDRIRAAADGWLESAGLSVRLSLGWASAAEGGDVMAAAAMAQERMREPGGPPMSAGSAGPGG